MATITYLTTIEFGAGVVASLGEQLAALGMRRPLIVSDRGLERTGLVERIAAMCPEGAPAFLDVPPNPTEMAALAALAVYREAGCDGVIAVGGGSPIDLGKAVALLTTHPGPLETYAAILGGIPKVTAAVDHVHHVMGEMQKSTLEHLFEMRAVMNPDQARRFDKTVVKALTAEAR